MKLFNIPDTPAFLKRILECSGDVYCRDSSGSLRDLKQAARQLTDCSWLALPGGLKEIDLVVQQDADSSRMIRYLMEAHCAR